MFGLETLPLLLTDFSFILRKNSIEMSTSNSESDSAVDYQFYVPNSEPEPPPTRSSSGNVEVLPNDNEGALGELGDNGDSGTLNESLSTVSLVVVKSRPVTSVADGDNFNEKAIETSSTNSHVPTKDFSYQFEFSAPLDVKFANLLETDCLTDVEFHVGDNEKRIRAHKIVLAISSPVFMAMFYGPLRSGEIVKLPDCDPEAFEIVINFIYGISSFSKKSDEASTIPVLYVAHKYDIKTLQDLCARKLSNVLNVWNVLSILETAEMYHLESVMKECWTLIQSNTRSVLNFHLQAIDYPMLLRIVQNENLSVDEVKLFELLNTWAENECEKENLIPTLDNKLRRLGDTLKYIRYPTMTASDFANKVASKGLLGNDQVARILTYICSTQSNRDFMHMDYPVTKRRTNLEDQTSQLQQGHAGVGSLDGLLPPSMMMNNRSNNTSTTATLDSLFRSGHGMNFGFGPISVSNPTQNHSFGVNGGESVWGNMDENRNLFGGGFIAASNNNPQQQQQSNFVNNQQNSYIERIFHPQQSTVYFGSTEPAARQVSNINGSVPITLPQLPQGPGWSERHQHQQGQGHGALNFLRATLEAHQRQASPTQRYSNGSSQVQFGNGNGSNSNHGHGSSQVNFGSSPGGFRFNRRIGRRYNNSQD